MAGQRKVSRPNSRGDRPNGRSADAAQANPEQSAKRKPATPPAPPEELLFATSNAGKLRELSELAGPNVRVLSPTQLTEQSQTILPEVQEDADTFVGNALLKACSGVNASGLTTLADDSGLCVVALGGAPGVRSARFSGPEATDASNIDALLERLEGVDESGRAAWFECALVLAGPLAEGPGCGRTDDGVAWRAFCGQTHGRIATERSGDGGFGYDPVFFSPRLQATFGEATAAEKHEVSHRGKAFGALSRYLQARAVAKASADAPMFLRPVGLQALVASFDNVLSRELRYADKALEAAMRARPQLGSKERAAVAELFWSSLRHLDRLQWALAALVGPDEAGIRDGDGEPRRLAPKHAGLLTCLALSSVDQNGNPIATAGARKQSALDGLLTRRPELAGELPATRVDLARALRKADGRLRQTLGTNGYHPEFGRLATAQLGEEHTALALAFLDGRGPLTLRTKAGATTRTLAELKDAGVAATATELPTGVLCLRSARVTTLPGFLQGRFEVQDLGSQWIAAAVAPQPGEKIADWCAGAGGKTLALADMMRAPPVETPDGFIERGELFALDVHHRRLSECRRRLQRAGDDWVAVLRHSRGDGPDTRLPPLDAVLVDAPCSSSGALRRNPELRWHLDTQWCERFPAQQLEILAHAAAHVANRGRLVYATCSILTAENEQVIAAFLDSHPGWTLRSERRMGPASLEVLQRHPLAEITPDGFYCAVLDAPAEGTAAVQSHRKAKTRRKFGRKRRPSAVATNVPTVGPTTPPQAADAGAPGAVRSAADETAPTAATEHAGPPPTATIAQPGGGEKAE